MAEEMVPSLKPDLSKLNMTFSSLHQKYICMCFTVLHAQMGLPGLLVSVHREHPQGEQLTI